MPHIRDLVRSSTRPRRARAQRPGAVVLLVVLLGALLAACSGADDAATGDAATAGDGSDAGFDGGIDVEGVETSDDGGGDLDDEAAGGDREGPGDTPAARQVASGLERIRTAEITLEFDDPDAAVDEVTRAVEERDGFVALADLSRNDETGELGGTVTLRVPSAALLPTLDALEALAEDAPVRRIEEEDVGAQLTDLRARIANLTAYEEELRALLTEIREATSDPDDLLPVVERLQGVRSDIDRLRAQRDGLEDRVALSTITVTLTSTATGAPLQEATWAPVRTVQEALAATGRALSAVADVVIWLVVTGLPVALVVAGPPLGVWWWWRRRNDDAAPTTSPPPSASPPPAA